MTDLGTMSAKELFALQAAEALWTAIRPDSPSKSGGLALVRLLFDFGQKVLAWINVIRSRSVQLKKEGACTRGDDSTKLKPVMCRVSIGSDAPGLHRVWCADVSSLGGLDC